MEDNQGTGAPEGTENNSPEDISKQIKGEMNRKFDKQNSMIAELQLTMKSLAESLKPKAQPKQESTQEEDIETLIYADPKKAMAIVEDRASKRALETMNRASSAQQVLNNTIAELTQEYPEIASADADLTKKTVEILNSLSEHERSSPMAYKYAVREAADQLSIKPRSKRDPDDFVAGGYNGYSPNQRREKVSDKKIQSQVTDMARLMGVDTSDPERVKRMVERAKRTSWNDPVSPFSTKKGRK